MRKYVFSFILFLLGLPLSLEAATIVCGDGASFHKELTPHKMQRDVIDAKGYITAVMHEIKTYHDTTVPGSFPGDISSPTSTSVPITEVYYGSAADGSSTAEGSFIVIFGVNAGVTRLDIHPFTDGVRFRFDPVISEGVIADFDCYSDIDDVDSLYQGFTEPAVGATSDVLKDFGTIFKACQHVPSNATTPLDHGTIFPLGPFDDTNWDIIL